MSRGGGWENLGKRRIGDLSKKSGPDRRSTFHLKTNSEKGGSERSRPKNFS
jgi:hypothetical protein